jgi:hypothetical protein
VKFPKQPDPKYYQNCDTVQIIINEDRLRLRLTSFISSYRTSWDLIGLLSMLVTSGTTAATADFAALAGNSAGHINIGLGIGTAAGAIYLIYSIYLWWNVATMDQLIDTLRGNPVSHGANDPGNG